VIETADRSAWFDTRRARLTIVKDERSWQISAALLRLSNFLSGLSKAQIKTAFDGKSKCFRNQRGEKV